MTCAEIPYVIKYRYLRHTKFVWCRDRSITLQLLLARICEYREFQLSSLYLSINTCGRHKWHYPFFRGIVAQVRATPICSTVHERMACGVPKIHTYSRVALFLLAYRQLANFLSLIFDYPRRFGLSKRASWLDEGVEHREQVVEHEVRARGSESPVEPRSAYLTENLFIVFHFH